MNYFYIITFDGQIFELRYTEEKLISAVDAWRKGELLIFKELGGGIHASSISKILNEDLYDSYTFNVKPKMYIKDGTWYDGKDRKIIRREKWKQKEVDKALKLKQGKPEEPLPPEQVRKLIDENTPDFIKAKKELVDKTKV